ncbi:heavy metal translocating P-type ATPase [Botrimarina sp.]|uniref:heavy metal translocating P-type ATPase n=1 Tax=Botrimarina sp. TaxID=2795802 RepID=UPI0032EAF875
MIEKTKIEIAVLLPKVPDARDTCVHRLKELLKGKDGIETAHLVEHTNKGHEELCIHYNPDRLSIREVRDLAGRAGVELDKRFGHLLLKSRPMYARQARTVELRASQIVGVLDAAASPAGVLRIEFDRHLTTDEVLVAGVQKLGLRFIEVQKHRTLAEPSEGEGKAIGKEHDQEPGGLLGERTELYFAVLCGGSLLAGWLLSTFSNLSSWAPWGLYVAAYLLGGFYTLRQAFQSLRGGRFEIDFLMLVAAVGAATLGEWAEGALLLFLFSLGHALEHYAMGRAKRAIEALAELAPQTAMVRREGNTEEMQVAQLRPGDVVIVKPNERIAADGFVIQGESSVNQAPITGESVPVDKVPVENPQDAAANPDRLAPQYRAFAGTINGSGALEIQVTKLASDSTLARVVQMVNEAETQKSPTQRFADKFERYFVPAVLAFVALLLFAWTVIDEPFGTSFYRAMAVLVAASPCALAISTPSAVLSGVARAARGGVLVKGGGPLENLGRVGAIAFDKTGTLTAGKPHLKDVVAADGVTEDALLRVAVAVEMLSDHPLAAAVARGGKERLKSDSVVQAQDVQSITGRGVKATVDGQRVYIGKDSLFSTVEGPPLPESLQVSVERLKVSGRTTMVVRRGDSYLGVLGLMDTPREAAKDVIARLRQLGVGRMIMLSGDNQHVANAVADEVGIDEAMGDLMPDDKVEAIKKLSAHGGVAMVGDGVNDAPAMANATVGIAMGAAGSDVALETADVALMADDLSHLPFAVGLSRQTSRIIRQNLWISLGMIAILVPATLVGLQMGLAVVFHEGSTLLVVLNALRLLAYQAK